MNFFKTKERFQNAHELYQNRKGLWEMLSDVWKGHYRMSFFTKLTVIFSLAYIFLPFDFDWIPLIGWIDDGIVGLFMIKRLLAETKRYHRFQNKKRKWATEDKIQDAIIIE